MKISENSVVTFQYVLMDSSGNILDNTGVDEPVTSVQGSSHVYPDIEKALEGREPGDSIRVVIPPERACGNRDDTLVSVVPRSNFRGIYNLAPGMQIPVQDGDDISMVRVLKVEGNEVTIDGNHPLAGETLVFDITITEVWDSDDERAPEADNGFMPGPGGK